MNEQLCKCGHYGHRQRDNSCRVTTCDCTSFRPAEPEQAASDDLLAAAKEFMLARHRLYFQHLENLTVGSNFIHSAAEFAAQRTAELEKRVEELDKELRIATDDYDHFKDACWYCVDPDIGPPIRCENDDSGGHWHHFLDPGDGLPSPCKNSHLFEAVFEDLSKRIEERVDVVLFCPKCKKQHIDKAVPEVCESCGHPEAAHMKTGCWVGRNCPCVSFVAWLNPPHKSHRCNWCNVVWRAADVPTNGVERAKTVGSNDTELSQAKED